MSNIIPSFGTVFNSDIDWGGDLFYNLMDYRPSFSIRRGNNMASSMNPRANVLKSDEGYVIELASPGFSRDDFQVNVENGALTVVGTAHESEDNATDSYTSQEFTCSSFSRTWDLPKGANVENLSASYEAGILNVYVPVENSQKKKHVITVE